MANKIRNTPEKRLPAIVDGAVWEKATKGRQAGKMWDSVVEKVREDIGENQEDGMSAEEFGRYKAKVKERIEKRERLGLRNKLNRRNI